MEESFQGIVLKRVEYSENDAIFTVLTTDNVLKTFKARGILKQNSKNAFSCNYFVLSDFILTYRNENGKTLKASNIVKTFHKPYNDLKVASIYFMIIEIASQVASQMEVYHVCLKHLNDLENNDDYNNTLLNYLKYVANNLGYEPVLGSCCQCQNKEDIVSFDFKEGGFICSKCFNSNYYSRLSKDFLLEIHHFLKNPNYRLINEKQQKELIEMYIKFYNDDIGVKINTQLYELTK